MKTILVVDDEERIRQKEPTMKTHIERLPEYYPSRDEDLAIVNWLTGIFPINRLSKGKNREVLKKMANKRMLVVDDEEKIRETYKRIFLLIGFDVETTPNAVDAQYLLAHNRFDVVLLDINMAEVDGSVLFNVMKTFHKNLKVVVSSVYPLDEQKERIRDADGYFDKSDDKDVLVTMVTSLLTDSSLPDK